MMNESLTTRRFDCLMWLVFPACLFYLSGVGAVSGDAIFHSLEIELNSWYLNPNHLLFDPLGVLWSHLFDRFGPRGVSLPDQLCVLSVLSAAVSMALVRFHVSSSFALSRLQANLVTLAFSSCSAFQRLMVSGEFFMVLMPFLILGVFFVLESAHRRSPLLAFLSGASLGFASLFMISQLLTAAFLGLAIAVWMFPRTPRGTLVKLLGAYGGGILLFTLIPLLIAWSQSTHATSDFLSWMLSYRGKAGNSDTLGYGAQVEAKSLLTAAARSVYGQICAFVDLSPLREVLAGQSPLLPLELFRAFSCPLSFIYLVGIFWTAKPSERSDSLPRSLIAAIFAATLLFGAAWDNSDDQFFFHTAICLALFMAMYLPRSPKFSCFLIFFLFLFNLWDLSARTLNYDRNGKVFELISITNDASLVIVPGADELETLTYFLPNKKRQQFLSVEALSSIKKFPEAMESIRAEVQRTLASGGQVVIVNIIDSSENKVPWKRLQKVGFGLSEVVGAFQQFETGPLKSTPSGISWRGVVGIKPKVIDEQPAHQESQSGSPQSGSL